MESIQRVQNYNWNPCWWKQQIIIHVIQIEFITLLQPTNQENKQHLKKLQVKQQ